MHLIDEQMKQILPPKDKRKVKAPLQVKHDLLSTEYFD